MRTNFNKKSTKYNLLKSNILKVEVIQPKTIQQWIERPKTLKYVKDNDIHKN